jgi:hypothetical protein
VKALAFLTSLLSATLLILPFVSQQQKEKIIDNSISSPELVKPSLISSNPLDAELAWKALKTKRLDLENNQSVDSLKSSNEDILTLGNLTYVLYGVFNANDEKKSTEQGQGNSSGAFILLKMLTNNGSTNDAVGLQKIPLGSELSPGIELVEITTNSIRFKQNNSLLEFKLFKNQS